MLISIILLLVVGVLCWKLLPSPIGMLIGVVCGIFILLMLFGVVPPPQLV